MMNLHHVRAKRRFPLGLPLEFVHVTEESKNDGPDRSARESGKSEDRVAQLGIGGRRNGRCAAQLQSN